MTTLIKAINYEGLKEFIPLQKDKIKKDSKKNIINNLIEFPIEEGIKNSIYLYNRLQYKCLYNFKDSLDKPDNRFKLINTNELDLKLENQKLPNDKLLFSIQMVEGEMRVYSKDNKINISGINSVFNNLFCNFKNEDNNFCGTIFKDYINFSSLNLNNLPETYKVLFKSIEDNLIQDTLLPLPIFIKELYIYSNDITAEELEIEKNKNISKSISSSLDVPMINYLGKDNGKYSTFNLTTVDFPLINNCYYEILSKEGHFNCYIDENSVIIGDKIQNISGKIRVKNITAPYKLKIIRNDNSKLKISNAYNFMQYNYPNIFKVMTEFPFEFPNEVDSENCQWFARGCVNILEFPSQNLLNCTNAYGYYAGCTNSIKFGKLIADNCKNMSGLYFNCNNSEIFPKNNTSKNENFSQYYYNCFKGNNYPLLDTSNGKNFKEMHKSNNSMTSLPNYDTSNGENFFEFISGSLITECKNINVSKAKILNRFLMSNTLLEIVDNLDTSNCSDFQYMFWQDVSLKSVCNIDLSSISLNIYQNALFEMLKNCNSLPSITFNNVPVGVTEEQLRSSTSAPETCEIIINYREIQERTPIRIIKAENMKLVDIDINGDMPIIREGNKPLDDYIVNSGDWGTIYDDGDKFKCFVTKDNLIYIGDSYNSTTRTELQPEVPEGIEIPKGSFYLNGKIIFENGSYNSFIFNSINNHPTRDSIHVLYQGYNNNSYVFKTNKVNDIDLMFGKYKNIIYEQQNYVKDFLCFAPLPYSSSEINMISFKQFNIYEGQLFSEELEAELEKIKGGN